MAKPVCNKCGAEHWRFVKCADAPAAEARDQQIAAVREQRKVVPIWRTENDRDWAQKDRWASSSFHRNEFVNPRPPEAA